MSVHVRRKNTEYNAPPSGNCVHIYARESTTRQHGELLNQIARLDAVRRDFLTFGTHSMGATYTDECSAFKEKSNTREGWCNMLRDARRGEIIMIERVDRMGRSYDIIADLDALAARGVTVRVLSFNSSYQYCRDQIIAHLDIAINESVAISNRATEHAAYQRAHGGHTGRIPIGYTATTNPHSGVRKLKPDYAAIHYINQVAADYRNSQQFARMNLTNPADMPRYMHDLIPRVHEELSAHAIHSRLSLSNVRSILKMPYGICNVCEVDDQAAVISCAGCFVKTHWCCVSPHMQEPHADWYCATCVQMGNMPNMACHVCDLKHSQTQNPIMICDVCSLGFHSDCIDVPNNEYEDEWTCILCAETR
jgi:DNA invertase Pin-like site-specific DNA recombinase